MLLAVRCFTVAYYLFSSFLSGELVIIGNFFILLNELFRINNNRIGSVVMLDDFSNAVGLIIVQKVRIPELVTCLTSTQLSLLVRDTYVTTMINEPRLVTFESGINNIIVDSKEVRASIVGW